MPSPAVQLHHPEIGTRGEVGILPPPQRHVELLGPVHVGDRHHHNLKFHVHDRNSSPLMYLASSVPATLKSV